MRAPDIALFGITRRYLLIDYSWFDIRIDLPEDFTMQLSNSDTVKSVISLLNCVVSETLG